MRPQGGKRFIPPDKSLSFQERCPSLSRAERSKKNLSVSRSLLAADSLRPSEQFVIAPRFGYKYATGIFA